MEGPSADSAGAAAGLEVLEAVAAALSEAAAPAEAGKKKANSYF